MVSVIVPNYNHAPFLPQRIESILAQSFQDFEIIILDDFSSDNSREILEEYSGHPKVTNIIFNPVNSGSVFKQWLKGIRLSFRKYIWIAESDDFANELFLETMVDILERNPNVVLAYCDAGIVSSGTKVYPFSKFSTERNEIFNCKLWLDSFKMSGKDFIAKYLHKGCCINNTSAVLFRAASLRNLQVQLESFRYTGDWASYLDLLSQNDAEIFYIPKELSQYRFHDYNASKKSGVGNTLYFERFRVASNCYAWSRTRNIEIRGFIRNVSNNFLPLLIVSGNRQEIFGAFMAIDATLARKMLKFIPIIFLLMLQKKIKL